jgi:DNA polymerase-3 subunit epsilon
MADYFKLRISLSRGIEDATAKKSQCTYLVEYYYRDATGRLAKVTVCEDGLVYRSAATFRRQLNPAWPGKPGQKPAPAKMVEIPGEQMALPVGAEPCPEAEYESALAQVLAYEQKKEEERLKEKAFVESLKQGMLRAQHAAEEADVAEPMLVPDPHFLDDFTILDFETAKDRPIELAAVRFVNWKPVDEMQLFVALPPGEYVPAMITELTGITSRMLQGAPDVKAVLKRFRALAGPSLLIAHNVTYDRRILEKSRTGLGATAPLENKWLCTLTVARHHYPTRTSHKLPDLCQAFGINTKGNHRALKDCHMTFELLRRMHQEKPVEASLVGCTSVAQAKKAAQPSLFAAA